ncbi:MAG: hypothetical protein Q4D45_08840 [Lachnospiraceae bacterium]|nr:hypothetical protein [Lachnospiraceae bacterium]
MKKIMKHVVVLVFLFMTGISCLGCQGKSSEQKLESDEELKKVEEGYEKEEKEAEEKSRKTLDSDEKIEKALQAFRKDRAEMDKKKKTIKGMEIATYPEEEKYGLHIPKEAYQFNVTEMEAAYETAKTYLKEKYGIDQYWDCIDPRILNIYKDKDKGVAKGYADENIYLVEYEQKKDDWQYLILVRENKEKPWKVLYQGSSYKK